MPEKPDSETFDIAVIGGGVNGAGIARDAAMRGLKVVLLEQHDICSGTSAWSSRLIHGGLRYLEYGEIPLVYESLHERRALRRIAPHLVAPLRITIPIYRNARRGKWLIRLGMVAYDFLSLGKSMPAHRMLGREQLLDEIPGLSGDGLDGGASYFDAQVTYAERLVLENALSARDAGADIRNWHRVTGMDIDAGRVRELRYEDVLTGESGTLRATVVINAAGPWVDSVLDTTGHRHVRLIGGTKGSHIVISRFDGAPRDALYVEAAADGRPIFIIPWNGMLLIGTTDIRFDDAPESARADDDEIAYLLGEANRIFPAANLGVADIHYTYSGVRPLPYREDKPESAITRKHIIRTHKGIAENLVSIIGGKLTTYRNLAEQAVDRAGTILGRRLPECRTADTPLPGGTGPEEAREALASSGRVSAPCIERLIRVYGGRARRFAAMLEATPALGEPVDDAGVVLAAEVALAVRAEFARTLVDIVFRRTMVGFDADQGRGAWAGIARVAAEELGWDAGQRERRLRELEDYASSLRPGYPTS